MTRDNRIGIAQLGQWLLAIAAVLDGASRTEAARIGGMDRQTLRDWVIRFNDQGPDGLINIPSPGLPAKLNTMHRAFLARIVEEGPIPAIQRRSFEPRHALFRRPDDLGHHGHLRPQSPADKPNNVTMPSRLQKPLCTGPRRSSFATARL
jgi:Winged helix-turn helix